MKCLRLIDLEYNICIPVHSTLAYQLVNRILISEGNAAGMNKYMSIFVGIVSIVTIIFIISLDRYQTQVDGLEEVNQELSRQNEQLSRQNQQLQAEASFSMEVLSSNTNADYSQWSEREEVAEHFYEDSNGRFKKSWGIYLMNEAEKHDLDPYLVYELLKVETGGTFDPELIGPETQYGHAYGMSQFMKNTAPWIAEMAHLPYSKELLFDPYYSMQLAVVYLDFLHHKYDNWDEALTAYHRGMTGMEMYKEANGTARSDYAKEIQTSAEAHRTLAMTN
ncbi:soluble lytic murein transglycosylase-like protein [Natronobacillus azotifigens]|uniref:Transglycosylase SLT domain-containing protein n=1 Tax=Natronobacillus azotifigens TaxID=472978 RepID=A0A9J6RF29_9BACI|nr:transglycosylase SLT domain-containing protein [Natronobacillus azotifigens]MCZ0704045.1 transglycosylase SLT domain-containing protein [Natronobacillus azotifigens]